MKTFTRTLAALFAVSLAALALSACKKVQPTELTENSSTATVVKGSIVYKKTTASGTTETSYSVPTTIENLTVTVTTKIKTGNIIEDEKGNKIEETIASVQHVPYVDKVYEAFIPVAAGEKYDVEVRCEFETTGYQLIGGVPVSGTVKYKGVEAVKVAYGQTFVCNITTEIDGFVQGNAKGAGNNSQPEP